MFPPASGGRPTMGVGWLPAFVWNRQFPAILTSVGVVNAPIVYQHLIEKDHTSVTGKRLLGKTS